MSFCFIWRKRKFRPYIETKLQFFYMIYMEDFFPKIFCAILTKIKGVSVFVSIPHCPMNYGIPAYSTVFFSFFFLLFIEQGLACNSEE